MVVQRVLDVGVASDCRLVKYLAIGRRLEDLPMVTGFIWNFPEINNREYFFIFQTEKREKNDKGRKTVTFWVKWKFHYFLISTKRQMNFECLRMAKTIMRYMQGLTVQKYSSMRLIVQK